MRSRRRLPCLVAAALVSAGCNPVLKPSPLFLTSNTPPVIQALYRSTDRAEVNGEIELTAVVSDLETPPNGMSYQWSASSGSFSGSGQTVRWRAPGVALPNRHMLMLNVVERYTLLGGGRPRSSEDRAAASLTVYVNDSSLELTKLAFTFVNDFVHSDRAPEYCVRNFSDNCGGKVDELGDVQRNRAEFIIDAPASTFTFRSISFDTPGNSPSQANFATVRLNCRFVSTRKATGSREVAEGICRLTNVYEDFRWRLCESRFDPPPGSTTQFIF